MQNLINYYNEYINGTNFGLTSFIFDIVLTLLAIAFLAIVLKKLTKENKVFIFMVIYLVLGVVTVILDLQLFKKLLWISLPASIIVYLNYHTIEVKHGLRNYNDKQTKQLITDQDDKSTLIKLLVKTVEHFSQRKIGAIITIEKENNLNMLIQQSIAIDAKVSYELLETIFHVNTALHDGAVVIRGNRIMCAGAFYRASDKADIPQHYGSRHRAAIGISEDSDAYTIVVSEETGIISATIDGTITSNLSSESLTQALNQHIIVSI